MFDLADRRARSTSRTARQNRLQFEGLEKRELLSVTPPTVTEVAVASSDWSSSFYDYLQTNSMGSKGYAIPTGSTAQTLALPWGNLNEIKITFSEDVNVDAADFSLSGINNTSYSVDKFYYDAFTHVATWTLDKYLTADRLMIDLDADGLNPVTDQNSNILDGDWTDDVTSGPSGDGTAGGDFEFGLTVLPGDSDQTQSVTYFDYIYTRIRDGQTTTGSNYSAFHDIDGGGLIDSTDWLGVIGYLGTSLPTGTPAGATNDAPTTAGFSFVDIDDDTVDVALSLFDAFEDAEDTDSQLAYQITENTNPALLDALSIDSVTGQLTISAAASAGAARTTVTVRATDTEGSSVEANITIDVNRDNQGPQIFNYDRSENIGNTWLIWGYVSDGDDDVEGFIVTFSGLFDMRATVDENGYFEFAIILDENDSGLEYAITEDPHGEVSNEPIIWLGLT